MESWNAYFSFGVETHITLRVEITAIFRYWPKFCFFSKIFQLLFQQNCALLNQSSYLYLISRPDFFRPLIILSNNSSVFTQCLINVLPRSGKLGCIARRASTYEFPSSVLPKRPNEVACHIGSQNNDGSLKFKVSK